MLGVAPYESDCVIDEVSECVLVAVRELNADAEVVCIEDSVLVLDKDCEPVAVPVSDAAIVTVEDETSESVAAGEVVHEPVLNPLVERVGRRENEADGDGERVLVTRGVGENVFTAIVVVDGLDESVFVAEGEFEDLELEEADRDAMAERELREDTDTDGDADSHPDTVTVAELVRVILGVGVLVSEREARPVAVFTEVADILGVELAFADVDADLLAPGELDKRADRDSLPVADSIGEKNALALIEAEPDDNAVSEAHPDDVEVAETVAVLMPVTELEAEAARETVPEAELDLEATLEVADVDADIDNDLMGDRDGVKEIESTAEFVTVAVKESVRVPMPDEVCEAEFVGVALCVVCTELVPVSNGVAVADTIREPVHDDTSDDETE